MITTTTPVLPTDIWAGWGHLDGLSDMFGAMTQYDEAWLVPRLLSDKARAILAMVAKTAPELLPVRLRGGIVATETFRAWLREIGGLIESAEERFWYQRRFLEVIDAGNRTGRFQIPIRQIPLPPIPDPASPFQQVRFEAMAELRLLQSGFVASLGSATKLTDEARWGRVMLSAVLFGGLPRARWLMALPEALANKADAELRWLDLVIEVVDRPDRRTRRVSDEVTGLGDTTTRAAPGPDPVPPLVADDSAATTSTLAATTSTNESDATSAKAPIRVLRRWFPDPLTRLLLREFQCSPANAPSVTGGTDSVAVRRLMKAYLVACDLDDHLPRSFRSLSDAVKTRLHLHLPPYLVEYAFENFESTSLAPHAWMRLVNPPERVTVELPPRSREQHAMAQLGPPAESRDEAGAMDGATPGAGHGEAGEDTDDPLPPQEAELWPAQLLELRRIVRGDFETASDRIKSWLAAQGPDLLPSVKWIARWVSEYLLKPGAHRHAKRPRTVYQFLRTAGVELTAHLGPADPTRLGDEDEYADLYEEVLEEAGNISTRRVMANALRSFHAFLMIATPEILSKEKTDAPSVVKADDTSVKKSGAGSKEKMDIPSVEETGVFVVSGRGGSRVDANVIGIATYKLAINELRSTNQSRLDQAVLEALCRVAGLGFFASLRRSEAIGLTLDDVLIGGDEVFIDVRPNPFRLLKTNNARRRLPLHILMPADELKDFRLWVESRREQEGDGSRPIFPMFTRPKGVRDTDPRLAFIVAALQAATGDPFFRFHHLRHSFSTWQVVQFWVAEQRALHAAIPDWFLYTEDDLERWTKAKPLRDRILGSTHTNRRALLQVSHFMGHGSADITLGSYVHLLDFLLGRAVRRVAPRIELSALAVLTGQTEAALKRLLAQHASTSTAATDDPEANWLDAVFIGPRGPGRPHGKRQPLPKVSFEQPPRLHLPSDPYARMMQQMDAANALRASPTGNAAVVAGRYGVRAVTAATAAKTLKKLPLGIAANFLVQQEPNKGPNALQGMSSGGQFAPPRGPAQEWLARKTLAGIERGRRAAVARRMSARAMTDRIRKTLTRFVAAWIPDTYLAAQYFETRHASDWLWLLDQVELKPGCTLAALMTISHVAGKGTGVPKVPDQRIYWQGKLSRGVSAATDPVILAAHQNPYYHGKVIIDLDRDRLGQMANPLRRNANFIGVRLALVAALCLPIAWSAKVRIPR